MAAQKSAFAEVTEACSECGESTPHDVSIELKKESTKGKNDQFSREPYRVTKCLECGETTNQRMNNA